MEEIAVEIVTFSFSFSYNFLLEVMFFLECKLLICKTKWKNIELLQRNCVQFDQSLSFKVLENLDYQIKNKVRFIDFSFAIKSRDSSDKLLHQIHTRTN